jgi:hypothetical protein
MYGLWDPSNCDAANALPCLRPAFCRCIALIAWRLELRATPAGVQEDILSPPYLISLSLRILSVGQSAPVAKLVAIFDGQASEYTVATRLCAWAFTQRAA